jgi:hypothetical protein
MKAMWVMICGPYRTNAHSEAERTENLRQLNIAALEVFRRGHVPIVGVNMALPLIQIAGEEQYDRIMMPLSLAAAERCDAAFRIGGPSHGADEEVERIRARGGLVFHNVNDLPIATKSST